VETETVISSFETLLAAQRMGTIQTDTFCAGCGYNLFSQGVVRDPNTRILLCRCPECGKFTPAGVATIADSAWRRAAGGLLILLRALILLFLIGGALILMGVIPYALAEEMIYFVRYRMGHYDPVRWQEQIFWMRGAFSLGGVGVGLGAGLTVVIGFYHWRKRFYYVMCLAPVLVLLVTLGIWRLDHAPVSPAAGVPEDLQYLLFRPIGTKADTVEEFLQNDYQYGNLLRSREQYERRIQAATDSAEKARYDSYLKSIDQRMDEQRQIAQRTFKDFRPLPSPAAHMGAMTLLAMLGTLVGVLIGRPVIRGLLRVLIPARALQSAAVLWFADGKVPPHVRLQEAAAVAAACDKVKG
jgi:hypothetical protein